MNNTHREIRPHLACMVAALCLLIAGCASAPSAPALPEGATAAPPQEGILGMLGGLADSALTAVGLKKPEAPQVPEVPDSALPDYRINWRLFASDALNVDEQGHSLALVVRVYRLKSPDAFLQAPADIFGDPGKEKATLGEDLIGVREVQLVPGQHHETTDKVARDARFIGIVALYRRPLPSRWRYAFSTASASKTGLHIGAHACAMSVQVGEAIGLPSQAVKTVAAPCP
jgi:type VI secretion system protein VasD